MLISFAVTAKLICTFVLDMQNAVFPDLCLLVPFSNDVPHNKEEICIGFQNVLKRITIATLRISVKQERYSKSAGAFKSDKIKQI